MLRLDEALRAADQQTGLTFSVYIGELETPIRNLFIIGDGAGITRGLIQASASGLIAARALSGRI